MFFKLFVHRREKLSVREKKKRKKRVVTVGMCRAHVKIALSHSLFFYCSCSLYLLLCCVAL